MACCQLCIIIIIIINTWTFYGPDILSINYVFTDFHITDLV